MGSKLQGSRLGRQKSSVFRKQNKGLRSGTPHNTEGMGRDKKGPGFVIFQDTY